MTAKRLVLSLMILLFASALMLGAGWMSDPSCVQPSDDVPPLQVDDTPQHALFPAFSADEVTAVSIVTPQTTFDLRRQSDHAVSVNGQQGDREVFTTLLEQISDMPITLTEPFSIQDTPVLTLVIRQHSAEYSASFFRNEPIDEFMRVLFHQGDVPTYGTTDGWRIGTLMLACEGIRIQDESGRETPLE